MSFMIPRMLLPPRGDRTSLIIIALCALVFGIALYSVATNPLMDPSARPISSGPSPAQAAVRADPRHAQPVKSWSSEFAR